MISTSSSGSDASVAGVLRDAAARLAATGSESPRLDAELLLGHILRVDRATLLASPGVTLAETQRRTFDEMVERRAQGEPVAYIRGLKEFYGLVLSVDRRALIPRPETETLVDLALDRMSALLTASPRTGAAPLCVWDVGTGSGAVAIALAVESRRRRYGTDIALLATDESDDTLALAVENAAAHGVADMIEFRRADLAARPDREAVDLLVANLPYIPSEVVPTLPVAARFEPRQALDGGPDGLRVIARLLDQLPDVVAPAGVALLEIGSDQTKAVSDLVQAMPGGWSAVFHDDLSHRPRVAEVRRAGRAPA